MRHLALPRPRVPVLVLCVWAIVLAGMFYVVARPVRNPSLDFFVYYYGASALHQGVPLYALESHELIARTPGLTLTDHYSYSPTLALLIQPFLSMPPYVASLAWFGVNVGLLLIATGLLFRQCPLRDDRTRLALLLVPVLFTPVLMNLYLGNVNLLVLVLILLAYGSFLRRRPQVSGALLALSTWIKIWPIALIAYFVWKREWKLVVGAMAGLLVIGGLTLALAGAEQTFSFFTDMLPKLIQSTDPRHDHLNQSIRGVFAKVFAPSSTYVQPLIRIPLLAQQGSLIATLLLAIATVLVCSRPILLNDRAQLATEFMLVIIATLLIAGWTWEASLSLLLPAYFFIAEELDREHLTRWRQVALPIASIILIDLHRVLWTLANPDKQAWPWYLLIFPFLGLMLMWIVLAVRRQRQGKNLPMIYLGKPTRMETASGS